MPQYIIQTVMIFAPCVVYIKCKFYITVISQNVNLTTTEFTNDFNS